MVVTLLVIQDLITWLYKTRAMKFLSERFILHLGKVYFELVEARPLTVKAQQLDCGAVPKCKKRSCILK